MDVGSMAIDWKEMELCKLTVNRSSVWNEQCSGQCGCGMGIRIDVEWTMDLAV